MSRTARSRPISSVAWAAGLLAVLAGAGQAGLILAGKPGLPLENLQVFDENDAPRELVARDASEPALLAPVYTRCAGTCPITTMSLRQAFEGRHPPFRVLIFSFDPADTAQDLRDFRAREGLPADWVLVRARDGASTRKFLDQLGFSVMEAPGGFGHPDETFVLSPRGAWTGTFVGADFSEKELDAAYRGASASGDPAKRLLLLSGAGLVVCLAAGVWVLGRVRATRRGPTRGP